MKKRVPAARTRWPRRSPAAFESHDFSWLLVVAAFALLASAFA